MFKVTKYDCITPRQTMNNWTVQCEWRIRFFCLITLLVVWDHVSDVEGRTVKTASGAVSGLVVTPHRRDLPAVEVFRGLPYAVAKRFAPPGPVDQWTTVRPATGFGPACPQSLPEAPADRGRMQHLHRALPLLQRQSEDCLYLNVYTPLNASPRNKHPVMVFVDGEGFQWSAGHLYDGTVLASLGRLVIVTLNYRLGVLGFLSAGRYHNLGLHDLLAALRWVQDNILLFGGDPSSVSLVGHGSGAACVQRLMASPAVPYGRLFHRVVLMSGSARSLARGSKSVVRTVAHHLSCPTDHRLLHCLRDQPLEVLLTVPVESSIFSTPLRPSEDGSIVVGSANGFFEKNHRRRSHHHLRGTRGVGNETHRSSGKYDLLFGVVNAEAFFFFNDYDMLFGIETDKKIKILESFVNETYRSHQPEILATLVNEYTGWERPVQHPANILQETEEALSDGLVVAPLVRAADLHSGSIYMYVFAHQSRSVDYTKKHGSVHGEELAYMFPGSTFLSRNFTKAEAHLSESFITYLANFVKTGDPNKANDLKFHPKHKRKPHTVTWLPYDKSHKRYLLLDTRTKMKDHYRAHRLSFWLNLVPQLLRGSDDVQLDNTIS